ncbi:MAG: N-acetylmuramoyl-L-alanine amidase [Cyanobacteria bacterium SID2]|nr:N-acetylmuramoyl-L-alanine amidase [Cyanobacteria bacterium SID2]MBP0003525.1 N-acetylmuramoyl-L-alanine amidase [Cyanobacteria bacterium SBC]
MVRVHGLLPSLASVLMVSQLGSISQAQTLDRSLLKAKQASFPTSVKDLEVLNGSPKTDSIDHVQVTQAPVYSQTATVEAVEITVDGGRVLVRTDRTVQSIGYWDRRTLAYQIEIQNARLLPGLRPPSARSSEAISWVQVEQSGPETVIVRVMPAPQVSVEGINQPSTKLLALELRPYGTPSPSIASQNGLGDLPRIPDGQFLIVLDPGHGGSDPGAVGIGGLSEIDIVNPMSHRIAELLEAQGVAVVLTREDNRTVELEPRVQLANRLDANLFVSIHANAISMSRPDVNGVETYYYQTGGDLARIVHQHLLQATGGPDRGVRTARFYVLRNTDMPAILLELGFVTGASDARRLADPDYRETLSQAISRGILQYVRQYCPGPLCE